MSLNELLIGTPSGKPWSNLVVASVTAGSITKTEYALSAGVNATQSIPNGAYTTVLFPVSIFNSNFSAISSGVATIPADGLYLVNAGVELAADAVGTRGVRLLLNGATAIAGSTASATSAGAWDDNVSALARFSASDTLAVQVFQSSGGALNSANASNVRFSLYRLSA